MCWGRVDGTATLTIRHRLPATSAAASGWPAGRNHPGAQRVHFATTGAGLTPRQPEQLHRPVRPPPHARGLRIAETWAGASAGAAGLLVVLIVVLVNEGATQISFLGLDFTMPIGVAKLFSAAAGVLVIALIGGVRIHRIRPTFDKRRR